MIPHERRDITNYLVRHGYAICGERADIVVRDPVQVLFGGGSRVEHKEVVIKDWPDAVKFVEERS